MRITGGLKIKEIKKESKEGRPLVSIVTPVFNGKKYLDKTIQSVLGQSYDNIEYIVIDGGSTDGSLEIIKEYEHQIDYWLSESDSGMYEAINKGIKAASGDILAYLNSDDLYYPDTVKIAVEYFQKNPGAELIYGNCDFIGSKGEFLYAYHYPKFKWEHFILLDTSSIPQQTTFWRRQIHKKTGYFDTTLKMCGDFDFYAKAGKCCRFDQVKRSLAKFRIHGDSLTAVQEYRNKGEVGIIHKRYLNSHGAYVLFLKHWIRFYIKLLNLPVMLKKVYFCFKKINH